MEECFSTRMGTAIRHAGHHLSQVRAAKKLLLVTDGEPADIDVRDPQYLRMDAKKAVEELGRQGVTPFCLTLDHVERLPERLPQLYAGLTR